jgi:hypothetical protein
MLAPAEVYWLLHDLCVEFGFCDALGDLDRFQADPPPTVDSFIDAVLLAEGFDPALPSDRHYRRMLRDMIAEAFQRCEARERQEE